MLLQAFVTRKVRRSAKHVALSLRNGPMQIEEITNGTARMAAIRSRKHPCDRLHKQAGDKRLPLHRTHKIRRLRSSQGGDRPLKPFADPSSRIEAIRIA